MDLVDEEELTSEIEQADAFKEGVYAVIIKIDKCTAASRTPILMAPPPEARPLASHDHMTR